MSLFTSTAQTKRDLQVVIMFGNYIQVQWSALDEWYPYPQRLVDLAIGPVWDRVCFASEPKKRIKPAKRAAADARCLAATR